MILNFATLLTTLPRDFAANSFAKRVALVSESIGKPTSTWSTSAPSGEGSGYVVWGPFPDGLGNSLEVRIETGGHCPLLDQEFERWPVTYDVGYSDDAEGDTLRAKHENAELARSALRAVRIAAASAADADERAAVHARQASRAGCSPAEFSRRKAQSLSEPNRRARAL